MSTLLSQAIADSGVKMTVTSGVNPRYVTDDWKSKADKWTCVLRYQNRTYTVPFFMGKGLNGETPTLVDVLHSLIMDISAYDSCNDAQEFGREFGYDDHATAERVYNACGRVKRNLYRLLGDELIDSLCRAENDI
jgi:hypothetical protein